MTLGVGDLKNLATDKYHVYLSCKLLRNSLAIDMGLPDATELFPLRPLRSCFVGTS